MRSIVCRFKDEADFLNHLQPGIGRRSPSFNLVTNVDLEPGSRAELVGLVSRLREDLRVGITVFEKTRVAIDDSDGRELFRYVCVVDPADAVWVEMFVQKLSVMADMRTAA